MSFIIIDRDGVINYESVDYIKSPEEWHAMPGSLEAIATLNRAGYRVVVATNQSGVGRGYYDLEMLDCIHEKLMRELASVGGYIDEIFFCPHHPDAGCVCRKPKPGLLFRIQEKYQINLAETFFIGDLLPDIQAALAAGCKPILVLTGNGEKTLENHAEAKEVDCFSDLMEAAQYILRRP